MQNINHGNIIPRSSPRNIDHGTLIGLADDDHPQYITHAEGNATYSLLGHTHTSAGITDFNEAAQDAVGGILTNGGGLTWTYNDIANTISVVVSIPSSSVTDFSEAVDDRVAGLLVAGTNIALTYNDVANTLTVSVIDNPSFSGNVTLGDAVGDSHAVNGSLTITGTAASNAFNVIATAGGDSFRINPLAATLGAVILSRNGIDTVYEPLGIFGEHITINPNGGEIVRIDSTGLGVFTIPTRELEVTKSKPGGGTQIRIRNSSSTANSDAIIGISVEQATGGDPYTLFSINGVLNWLIGVDNSDSDKFKISGNSSALGTNDYLIIDTTGDVAIPNHIRLGDGSVAAPSYSFSGQSGLGFYRNATGAISLALASVNQITFDANIAQIRIHASGSIGWTSLGSDIASDLKLFRDAANTLALRNGVASQELRIGPVTNYLRVVKNAAGDGVIRVSDNNNLSFGTNNNNNWQISANGHWFAVTDNIYDIGASGATRPRTGYFGTSIQIGTGTQELGLDVVRSVSGGQVAGRIRNSNAAALSYANLLISVEGSAAGDPFLVFDINTVIDWSIGIDNSDSDKFKFTASGTLGDVNDMLTIDTSGNVVILQGSLEVIGGELLVGVAGTTGSAIGTTGSATSYLTLAAGIAGVSSLRIPHGVAPTTPVNGDIWTTTVSMFARINGATVDLAPAGYTDEQAQDAVGTILLDSASIDFTYTDATPEITAIVKPNLTLTSLIVNGTIDINVTSDDTALDLTSTGVGSTVGLRLNIPTDSWTIFIGASTEDLTFRHSSSVVQDLLYLTNVGSVIAGNRLALATNATDGFLYVPTSAGVPTGTPTSHTGKVPIEFDTTNNRLYVYNGSWRSFAPKNVIELTADVASSASTAFQNVTGLSFGVTSGINYRVRATLMYTTSAATIGIRVSFTGPAMTHNAKIASTPIAVGGSLGGNVWHDGSMVASSGVASTSSMGTIEGNIIIATFIFRPSASGTFQLVFAPETATASGIVIEAGSTLEWW